MTMSVPRVLIIPLTVKPHTLSFFLLLDRMSLMVSDRVLDVYPHDQGQYLDEELRTDTVEIPRPA